MNDKRLTIIVFISTLILSMIFVTKQASAKTIRQMVDVQDWIINTEESSWDEVEVALVEEALQNTIEALDDAGSDGLSLLSGYQFRRQHQEFVDGVDGRIALVRHQQQEIILSDTAFLRLQGYYIYHELGHVVDNRMDRKLSEKFHASAGSAGVGGSQETADGFWLNEHARTNKQEATADAFALWIVLNYTDNYRPVFWNTPYTVSYEGIVDTMVEALSHSR